MEIMNAILSLVSLAFFAGSVALFAMAGVLYRAAGARHRSAMETLAISTRQFQCVREWDALREYGAEDEARQMLETAIKMGEKHVGDLGQP